MSSRGRSSTWPFYALLLLLCLVSRIASAIYYIEDPDSLRFALSVARGFDLERLQPHFPGYPVFWALAHVFYGVTGSFAVSFSLIGGIAVFLVIYYLHQMMRVVAYSVQGLSLAAVVFFNPLVWLLSNRYMPDLLGLAAAVACFYYLSRTREKGGSGLIGAFLVGLLGGIRLSYIPFVAVPALYALVRSRGRVSLLFAGVLGVAVWLVPMIIDTGWAQLLQVARSQSAGHFTDFGGTVATEPDFSLRLVRFVQNIWADGLGGYWAGRHALTLLVSIGLIAVTGTALAVPGWWTRIRARCITLGHLLIGASVVYAGWILLYQNIIHKSRHVLPLLVPAFIVIAMGTSEVWRRGGTAGRVLLGLFFACYVSVCMVLVAQHRQPTAVSQAATYVRKAAAQHPNQRLHVVSIPLVHFYLGAQEVDAEFVSIGDSDALRELVADRDALIVAVGGDYLEGMQASRSRTFYHNPYVNRMWPVIEVHVYEDL